VSNRIKALLIVLLFFVGFTGVSILRLVTIWHADQTNSWTPATGRVTATAYAKAAWYDNFQFSGRRAGQLPNQQRNTRDQLVPKISYRYTVAGRTYVGTRYQFSRVPYEMGNIQEILRKYPIGSPVPLYFDPGQPNESVLLAGSDPTDRTIGFMTGGCALAAGFYLIWAGLLSGKMSTTSPERKPQ
jgi:Protein of unknown function (DUF3592)